ncbi:MAG: hypothetical protein K6G60_10080 [Lachnospiraceae bacterium]|nr:hypothetical protein [Lachnospiraceae bacterium]
MKKFFATLLAAIMIFAATEPATANAGMLISPKPADVVVYVSIVNGDIKLAQHAVTVKDIDNDGALTINDALYLAHEAKFNGGAAAGYGSAQSQWGLSLTKLWGVENGGSYGYYVNNASAMGLTDPVKNGDYVNAFVYTDTVAFSDSYAFFNENVVTGNTGKEIKLTLSAAGYDANWNPVTLPVANATITVDGVKTNYKTDADGKVTIKVASTGRHIVSAVSDSANLVPPVLVVTSSKDATPKTGDNSLRIVTLLSLIAVCGVVMSVYYGKKANER